MTSLLLPQDLIGLFKLLKEVLSIVILELQCAQNEILSRREKKKMERISDTRS